MTVAAYPGGYTLFVGDTDGMVHASDDGGDNWIFVADATQDHTPPQLTEAVQFAPRTSFVRRCPRETDFAKEL
jgi:hypothetical protein